MSSNLTDLRLSFDEIFAICKIDGCKTTHLIQGEPGIGKTTIGKRLATELNYPFAYVDMANISLGDLTTPYVDKENKCSLQLPNEILQLHKGEPVVLLLDEWTKAGREAKNMTLPLALERRLGSIHLHPASIVIATGNYATDGVGDSIQGHQLNRFTAVTMAKPSAAEWIQNYAIPNGIDETVCAFVEEHPKVMQSYKDDTDNMNEYIYNPKKLKGSYCSPRSLEFASHHIKTRERKSLNALHAQLVGDIGASAAADLICFVNNAEKTVPMDLILKDPLTAPLPDQPVIRLLQMFKLLMNITPDNLARVLEYVKRFENEFQAIFINRVMSCSSIGQWAAQVKEMRALTLELTYMLN